MARGEERGDAPGNQDDRQDGQSASIIPVEQIQNRILLIRGQKVILDSDLAELYGVPTKRLNEQVKRNIGRFPSDFMFQLSEPEKAEVVANCDHLQRRKFSPSDSNAWKTRSAPTTSRSSPSWTRSTY
jgi:hypothetical protein